MARQQFGADAAGGFNEFSKAYKRSPTIENYVTLRRRNPEAEIEVSVVGGMESLFALQDEFCNYGFEPDLIASVMDADEAAISEVALRLMERIIEARIRAKKGESQLSARRLVVPDKMIDWLIACTLDALSWNDCLYIPRDLIVLIRERLGGSNLAYQQKTHTYEQKSRATVIAGQLSAQGIRPTFKVLGRMLGVAPSTVKRWFGPGEFERETKIWANLCDGKGKFLSVDDLRKRVAEKKIVRNVGP